MLTTWIIAGVVLLLVELVVPGMVLGFLGASALLVAGLVWMGWTDTWVASLTAWFVISLVLLVTLRGLFQKLVGGEVDRQTLDDESDAYGEIVEVVETITPEKQGRIRYRGSTWLAACPDQTIDAGVKAMLAYRDNLVWVVERAEATEIEAPEQGED
jgi:membrane protein implicated in regulation of membrane protease activity